MAADRVALHRLHYRRLGLDCIELSLGGFRVDEQRREELEAEVARECARLKAQIRSLTPFDIFGKGKRKGEDGKGLSNPQVQAYFYGHLKCKPIFKSVPGQGRRITCDEEAIRRLMRSYKKARPVGQLVLEFRSWQKRGDFVDPKRIDEDGYFRAFYAPTAVSGQMKSSENPLGTGGNGQNYPRPPSPVREIMVPDKGHVLIELDFSRIEQRLLFGMSGDPKMMREAQPEWTGDSYQQVAESLEIAEAFEEIFGKTTDDDDPTLIMQPKVRAYYVRQTGKRTLLSAGYDTQGETLSRAILLETEGALALEPKLLDTWLVELKTKIKPGIKRYQDWVSERMLRDGYLENSWGRRIYFRKLRLVGGDYRDGFAWCCQSEDRCDNNILGMHFTMRLFKREALDARYVQNGHDAGVISVNPSIAYDVLCAVGDSMGQPREYPGAAGPWSLACPIGMKVGANWGSGWEWKKRPSREVFEAKMAEVLERVWWRRRR